MNDALRDFKIWFEGFAVACGDACNTSQWMDLKSKVKELPYGPFNVPKDVIGGYDTSRLHISKDALATMGGNETPAVPRYPDEQPI